MPLSEDAALGFAMTTKSQAGNCRCLNDSRAKRFNLFLSVALLAARRETVSPSLAMFAEFARAKTVKNSSEERFAPAKTLPKSFEDAKRRSDENCARGARTQAMTSSPALRAESRASFCSAVVEYLAATTGCHARAKTMRSLAAQLAWLKCSLHDARNPNFGNAFRITRPSRGQHETVLFACGTVNSADSGCELLEACRNRLWISRPGSY